MNLFNIQINPFSQYKEQSIKLNLKNEIQTICQINLKKPPVQRQKNNSNKIFQMSEIDLKKMNYLINIAQIDNQIELKRPFFYFYFRFKPNEVLIPKWKIRSIDCSKEKIIIDYFGIQYMTKNLKLNRQSEQFLYPLLIGKEQLAPEVKEQNLLINGLLKEGETTYKINEYPMREEHKWMYNFFALLFLSKFLYKIYQIKK